jgi:site-specific recombinase XerD
MELHRIALSLQSRDLQVGKLLPVFGKVPLANITPQSMKAYLDTRDDLTKTTINRYRGTISMIFQEAIRNGKATANPAWLVRLHREDNGRVRFVTFAEEAGNLRRHLDSG